LQEKRTWSFVLYFSARVGAEEMLSAATHHRRLHNISAINIHDCAEKDKRIATGEIHKVSAAAAIYVERAY
jgi:hypothetical protein